MTRPRPPEGVLLASENQSDPERSPEGKTDGGLSEAAGAFAVNLAFQVARRVFAARRNPAVVRLDLRSLTNVVRSAIDVAVSETPRLLGWSSGNAEEAGAARGMQLAITICDQVVAEYAAGDLRIRDWTAHEVARRLKDELIKEKP